MPEVPAQLNDSTPEVPAQTENNLVTAAAPAVDNATTQTIQEIASPQTAAGGQTGEVGDEQSDYAARKAAFLSGKAPEATPPAAQTVEAPAPAAVVNPPEDPEDAPLIKDGQMPKMRVRTVTPVDVEAVAAFQTSQKLGNTQSLVEFIAENYVPKLPATQQTAEAPAETGPTLESVSAELEALEKQRDDLQEGFEFDQANELKPKIKELREKEKQMLLQSVTPQAAQEQAQAAAEEPYLIQAAQMFPQSVEANSPLAVKAREIYAKWTADKDPRAAHPSSAFYCYVDAAAQLSIKPSGAPASQPQVTQPSPTSPVHRPPASALIAGGDARTQTTRTPATTGTYQERKQAYLKARPASA
ncbi:MAG: hypothetical protein WAW39_01870 [Prosthecobacter sp.]|uniref:hypothetical protein n=1 Tax=Prosthecobacter sp. TaxID=1965333 RepID=UPI003BB0CCC0